MYTPSIFSFPKSIVLFFNVFSICHHSIIFNEGADPEERNESLLATGLFLATLGKLLGISGLQVEEHQSVRSPCPPDLFVKTNKQARMQISTLPSSEYPPPLQLRMKPFPQAQPDSRLMVINKKNLGLAVMDIKVVLPYI